MVHPFLSEDQLLLIKQKIESKKKHLESNMLALKPLVSTHPDREKVGSEDVSHYENAVRDLNHNKAVLEKDQILYDNCEEKLTLLETNPSKYGFDKKTGLPISAEILLFNLLLDTLPPHLKK